MVPRLIGADTAITTAGAATSPLDLVFDSDVDLDLVLATVTAVGKRKPPLQRLGVVWLDPPEDHSIKPPVSQYEMLRRLLTGGEFRETAVGSAELTFGGVRALPGPAPRVSDLVMSELRQTLRVVSEPGAFQVVPYASIAARGLQHVSTVEMRQSAARAGWAGLLTLAKVPKMMTDGLLAEDLQPSAVREFLAQRRSGTLSVLRAAQHPKTLGPT